MAQGHPPTCRLTPPPTHTGSAQPSPHPSQAPSANIAQTHPGDHTAIEAGQPGVIIGDLLLHHPVGRQCHETTRMRAGSHQWALEGTPPHILVQGTCQPRVSRHMPRCRQSVWMPLPGAIPSGGPLSSSCRPLPGPRSDGGPNSRLLSSRGSPPITPYNASIYVALCLCVPRSVDP